MAKRDFVLCTHHQFMVLPTFKIYMFDNFLFVAHLGLSIQDIIFPVWKGGIYERGVGALQIIYMYAVIQWGKKTPGCGLSFILSSLIKLRNIKAIICNMFQHEFPLSDRGYAWSDHVALYVFTCSSEWQVFQGFTAAVRLRSTTKKMNEGGCVLGEGVSVSLQILQPLY